MAYLNSLITVFNIDCRCFSRVSIDYILLGNTVFVQIQGRAAKSLGFPPELLAKLSSGETGCLGK